MDATVVTVSSRARPMDAITLMGMQGCHVGREGGGCSRCSKDTIDEPVRGGGCVNGVMRRSNDEWL